jgi:hypothetical protein
MVCSSPKPAPPAVPDRGDRLSSARSEWRGESGIGAVLFAGLAIGALDLPSAPEIVHCSDWCCSYIRSASQTARASSRRWDGGGLRINALVVVVLIVVAGLTLVTQRIAPEPADGGRDVAGTLTNTPTLAAELGFSATPAPTALNRRRHS